MMPSHRLVQRGGGTRRRRAAAAFAYVWRCRMRRRPWPRRWFWGALSRPRPVTTWRPRAGSAGEIDRHHGSARHAAGGRPQARSGGRSRRWWSPAIFPRGDDRAWPPRLHRARRSLRRGTDIAARATARVRVQAAVARPKREFGSSARLPPAATRAGAGPQRSEHLRSDPRPTRPPPPDRRLRPSANRPENTAAAAASSAWLLQG